MINRYDLPAWSNRLIDAIADAPTGLVGRMAAMRLGRPARRGTVPATTFEPLDRRVFIAPVNYSGQGRAWSRALEAADPSISARNMAVDVPGGFDFDADVIVPVATYHNDADWQRRQLEAAAAATHVLIEASEPPFGRLLGRSVRAQAEALLARGVDVAYLAHGTDVRLPSRHMQSNPWSHYADRDVYAPRAEELARRNIAFLTGSGRPLFVSTPDLIVDLPDAAWCPVAVDTTRWAVERSPRPSSAPLRVAHAPSVSVIKGTELILPALKALDAEGVIELRIVQGVPSAQMRDVFAEADVVIDQMRIGSYGVAAVEAMAAGCVVVGHVSAPVRGLIAERTGLELPIVEATPDNIETVLREVAAAHTGTASSRGVEFVRKVHDGRRSAQVLLENWIDRKGHIDASTR